MKQALPMTVGIGYFVIGIVQFFAIVEGLAHWFGISGFVAFILSLFIAYIPLIGSVAGFTVAIDVWGWSTLEAGSLFFCPVVLLFVLSWISGMISKD